MTENRTNISNLFKNADEMTARINSTTKALDEILGNQNLREDIRATIANIREITDKTNTFMQNAQGLGEDIRKISGAFADSVGKLTPLTEELERRGPYIIKNADEGLARLNQSLAQVERFTTAMNSDKGSIGQLISNPELYQQLNEAATNINDLTRRMKPIVEDARVLSDRISRNPGIILRDAVKPGAGTKWTTPERTGRLERDHFQEYERGTTYYE
ncbi:MAG: hypothetical protein QM811_30920 [Pirellulales bacterium]